MTAQRSLTACIVDDEELARRGVRARLDRHDDVEIGAECASGREAVEALQEDDFDLVFLDVQMPGLDGFDVIEAIGPEAMPVTIFVTAYDEHALKAFEAQALDYLLKPLDEERFDEALGRARDRIAQQTAGELGDRLGDLLAQLDPEEGGDAPDRFVVKASGRVRLVKTEDIRWVEAAGDYVRLHTGDKTHLLRRTMQDVEETLEDASFLRIHRSTIVNVEHVAEMRPYGSNNEYVVVLDDGTERKLSRTYYDAVNAFFDGAL
jgi:two-component system LytT family response regulator